MSIGAIGLLLAFIDWNMLPLLVALFAIIFLSASLIQTKQPTSRLFIRRLVASALLVALMIGTFNYVVNPFALYPPHVFEPLVLTTRDYKMELYTTYSPPPQAVVMGSSRSFGVDPDQVEKLWGYRTFNFSVAGSTLQDSLALLRYIAEVGKLPDLLIINLTPEAFWSNEYLRYTLEPNARLWNLMDVRDVLMPLKDGVYRLTSLLSKQQLDASLRVLQIRGSKQAGLSNFITVPNGMIRSPELQLKPADLLPDKVSAGITYFFRKTFTQYQPDLYMTDVLQQILELAKQHHMLVIGYMPPYHPAMRDALETQTEFTPILNYITAQLDHFEKEYPFHYINFIDSHPLSDDATLFFDYIHPTEQASILMMQQLYDQFHTYSGRS